MIALKHHRIHRKGIVDMFKSILFPTDGSPASLLAAERLAALLNGLQGVKVTLAVAFTPIDTETTDYDPGAADKQNLFLRDQAGRYLSAAAGVFQSRGIPVSYRILEGKPISRVLAEEADLGDYDAVAMGSRGMGMSETDDNYLGSVTERVIRRASTPVVVIPVRKS